MKVVVLYNEPETLTADDQDVLVQRDTVKLALEHLGHSPKCLGCTLDLELIRRELVLSQPDVVFNLVESLGGSDRLMVLPTILLDSIGIPFTGAPTEAILASANKLTAKQKMRLAGLPTADWFVDGQLAADENKDNRGWIGRDANRQWILKPIYEHASFGVDDDALVVAESAAELTAKLVSREQVIGEPLFAERYVEGREFNLSLLAGRVLPPAEIEFVSFPAGKPRIVGQRAKWDEASFEYRQTPRNFEFSAGDDQLLGRLTELAERCWCLFGLGGYARVDFRVDDKHRPWILEVNVNPCLSPDAGYAAAVSHAGIPFTTAVQTILDAAFASPRPSTNADCGQLFQA